MLLARYINLHCTQFSRNCKNSVPAQPRSPRGSIAILVKGVRASSVLAKLHNFRDTARRAVPGAAYAWQVTPAEASS